MKRWMALLCVAAALLTATGCHLSGDMLSQLAPPKLTGEQQSVQDALDKYLSIGGEEQHSTLEYPKRGSNRSAILLADMDGDGGEEAITFYSLATDETIRLHLMRRNGDGEWINMADLTGVSTEIDEVAFADLDGDNGFEMLVGWTLYNSRDKQLTVFSYTPQLGLNAVGGDQLYSTFVTGDLIQNGSDQLVLFRADNSINEVTVTLEAIWGGVLGKISTAKLDGHIQSFQKVEFTTLGETTPALFIDCNKDASVMLTELIWWDSEGQQLVAPFYQAASNLSSREVREVPLTVTDIDNDGVPEIPSCRRLHGYETTAAADSLWLTTWSKWKMEEGRIVETKAFDCVMNTEDGYYFRLEDWMTETDDNGQEVLVTAAYLPAKREWTLYHLDDEGKAGHAMLTIRAVPTNTEEEDEDETDTRKFKTVTESVAKQLEYQVWLNSETKTLTMQRVAYDLVVLP